MNEDIAERILTATLPHCPTWSDPSPDFAIQDAALACAGMPQAWYLAVCWRILGDYAAAKQIYARLHRIAYGNKHKPVNRRAGLLAALVLAEDRVPSLVERVPLTHAILQISRQQYRRDILPVHQNLRAKLDSWTRSGVSWIVKRVG
jgi:hypothetical protein